MQNERKANSADSDKCFKKESFISLFQDPHMICKIFKKRKQTITYKLITNQNKEAVLVYFLLCVDLWFEVTRFSKYNSYITINNRKD